MKEICLESRPGRMSFPMHLSRAFHWERMILYNIYLVFFIWFHFFGDHPHRFQGCHFVFYFVVAFGDCLHQFKDKLSLTSLIIFRSFICVCVHLWSCVKWLPSWCLDGWLRMTRSCWCSFGQISRLTQAHEGEVSDLQSRLQHLSSDLEHTKGELTSRLTDLMEELRTVKKEARDKEECLLQEIRWGWLGLPE